MAVLCCSNKTYTEICEHCKRDIAVAGLSRILDTKRPKIQRIMWMIIVMASAGLVCYLLAERIGYYMSDPMAVDLRLSADAELHMPAFTLCTSFRAGEHPINLDSQLHHDVFYNLATQIFSHAFKSDYKPKKRNFTREEMNNFPWQEFLDNLWPRFQLIQCAFVKSLVTNEMVNCDMSDFKLTRNNDLYEQSLHIPCYTIYGPSWTVQGTDGFLWLKINDSMPYKVVYYLSVHQPDESPMIFSNTIKFFNKEKNVGMKYMVQMTRSDYELAPQFCKRHEEQKLRFFDQYSFRSCHSECFVNFTLREDGPCKCYMPYGVNYFNSSEICLPHLWKTCFREEMKLFRNQKEFRKCGCKPLCTQHKFFIEVEKTKLRLKATQGEIRVFVKFKTIEVQTIHQKKIGTFYKLLAEVGGVLALGLGMRLLSIVEIIDVCIYISCGLITKSKRRLKQNSSKSANRITHVSKEWNSYLIAEEENRASEAENDKKKRATYCKSPDSEKSIQMTTTPFREQYGSAMSNGGVCNGSCSCSCNRKCARGTSVPAPNGFIAYNSHRLSRDSLDYSWV